MYALGKPEQVAYKASAVQQPLQVLVRLELLIRMPAAQKSGALLACVAETPGGLQEDVKARITCLAVSMPGADVAAAAKPDAPQGSEDDDEEDGEEDEDEASDEEREDRRKRKLSKDSTR